MAEEQLISEPVPPDKHFKCHSNNTVGVVVCLVSENVFHKREFITNKGIRFISQVMVVCDEHESDNIT